ncbi:hypothetical protein Daus18300_010433 [Diaporthe australafricana]|uniref:Uncharacterized protein n=1 Tax=Diaporthe australafricana TaxID=127596 RepID=A0ABR3WAX0_9PEZI
MAERNARMMGPMFRSCPLCGVTKDHPTVTGRLEDHVVGHLRLLALRSLPFIEEEHRTESTNSLKSDDSAKPADRRTVRDLLEEPLPSISENEDKEMPVYFQPDVDSNEDPYAAWGGINSYVKASHILRQGEPPQQIKLSYGAFPFPEIPESGDIYKLYIRQRDDSSRFVDGSNALAATAHKRDIQVRQAL